MGSVEGQVWRCDCVAGFKTRVAQVGEVRLGGSGGSDNPAAPDGKPRTCQSCFKAPAVMLKRTPSGKRRWKCERCLRWSSPKETQ